MKKWKNLSKRGLALLLALVMCMGMMQITAFAEEPEGTQEPVAVETAAASEEPSDVTPEEPSDETPEEPSDETPEEPSDETPEEPSDETPEEPSDETPEEPSDETPEEPSDETPEEPSDEISKVPEEIVKDTNSGVVESIVNEVQNVLPVPAEVQDFLDAVEAIPADINPDNAEEVGAYVYGEVADAYEALLGTEYEDRSDVQEAAAAMAAAREAVQAALGMESETLATNITVYDHTLQEVKAAFSSQGILQITGASVDKGTGSRKTIYVGENATVNFTPVRGLQCRVCGSWLGGGIFAPTKYCELSATDTNQLVSAPTFGKGISTDSQAGRTECLEMRFTGVKPGVTNIPVSYYCNFELYYDKSLGDNGGSYDKQCYYCYVYYGRITNLGYVQNDATWHKYTHTVPVIVNARYQLNYDLNGGTGTVNPTTKDVATTTATLTVTSSEPTREGYTFKGWAETQNGAVAYNAGNVITLNWSEGYGSTANPVSKTLYAIWEEDEPTPAKTYTVIYKDGAEGKVFGDEGHGKLKAGDATPAFANGKGPNGDPTREGYTFMGWSPAVADKVDPAMANANDEITYTATWKQNTTSNKPAPPTEKEVNTALKQGVRAAVEVYCQPERHLVGYFDCYNESKDADGNPVNQHPGRVTIGAVQGDETNGYTCNVTFLAEKYLDGYNTLKKTTGDKAHVLCDEQGNDLTAEQANVTVTFQWNGTKWVLANGVTGPVKFWTKCPENTEKEQVKYKVQWIDEAGDTVLKTEERTAEIGIEVTVKDTDKTYTGYTFDADNNKNVLKATLDNDKVVLKMYFKKNSNPNPNPDPEPVKTGLTLVKKVNGEDSVNLTVDNRSGELTYTITVTNNTNVELANMLIRDKMPEGVTLVEGSGSATVNGEIRTVTVTETGAYHDWKVDGIVADNAVVVLTYKADVTGEGEVSATNTAKAFAKQAVPAAEAAVQGVAKSFSTSAMIAYNATLADYEVESNPASTTVTTTLPANGIETPDGYGDQFESNSDSATVTAPANPGGGGEDPDPKKPEITPRDLQQVAILLKCSDGVGHDAPATAYQLGGEMKSDGLHPWYNTWRTIGEVEKVGDTYQCVVTLHANAWGDFWSGILNNRGYGVSHVFDQEKTGGDDLQVTFTYVNGAWTTETEVVTVWVKEMVTVTYKDADGTVIGTPETEDKGTEFTIQAAPVAPEGKEFDHWSGDDGERYQPGDKVTPEKDLTLTVVWKNKDPITPPATEYTITVKFVDENDEEIRTSETESTTNGGEYDVSDKKETKIEGYTFKEVQDGSPELSGKTDKDITITLVYTKDEEKPGPDPEEKDVSYTVVHEYYTNGTRNDSLTVRDTVSGKVGSEVKAADIEKKLTAGGNSYTYTSAAPESLTLEENADTNIITLRYDRTTGGGSSGGGGSTSTSTRYTLTVNYVYEDGTQAAPTHTERLSSGDSYRVTSPDLEGYTPDQAVVSGTMSARNVTETVVYTANSVNVPDEQPPLAEIPEEDVPLADIPEEDVPLAEIPEEDAPLADIPEETVPLADVPKTGDNSLLWLTLAGLAGAGLALLTFGKKNREDAE